MTKYDLQEAFERLAIPEEFRPGTKYFEIPLHFLEFGVGQANQPKKKFKIIATGDKITGDFLLAHEILGHGMDPNNYNKHSFKNRILDREKYATMICLEKLIDLEKKHPNEGYKEVFDQYFNRVKKETKTKRLLGAAAFYVAGRIMKKNKIKGSSLMKLFALKESYMALRRYIYDERLDIKKLEKKRMEVS